MPPGKPAHGGHCHALCKATFLGYYAVPGAPYVALHIISRDQRSCSSVPACTMNSACRLSPCPVCTRHCCHPVIPMAQTQHLVSTGREHGLGACQVHARCLQGSLQYDWLAPHEVLHCLQVVDAECYCSSMRVKRRCGNHEFSCGGVCHRRLDCGHRCPKTCHEGECPGCQEVGGGGMASCMNVQMSCRRSIPL